MGVTLTLSMDQFTKDVEVRSSAGRRVAVVKAMASEAMTLRYADIMCSALNAAGAELLSGSKETEDAREVS